MMSGYDCLNEKRFNSRRKVDSELVATTSVGSVFQMCGVATAKARLPTVDSLTVGISRTECSSIRQVVDLGNVVHRHAEPCTPEQPACTEFVPEPASGAD